MFNDVSIPMGGLFNYAGELELKKRYISKHTTKK